MPRAIVVLLSLVVMAAAPPRPGVALGPIRIEVDGSAVRLDQPPVLIGGRVLVPLRGVFEHMGALVTWKAVSQTVVVIRQGVYLTLRVGDRTALVSGTPIHLDVPAQLLAGRVLVPLRFIGEAFGARVQWRAADRTAVIWSASAGPAQGSVLVELSSATYAPGQAIVVNVANGTTTSIYTEDAKTACSIVTLERKTTSGWEPLLGCRLGRPTLTVEIKPGVRRTAMIDPKSFHLARGAGQLGFGAGTYRIRFSYRSTAAYAGVDSEIVYSPEFQIR